MFKTPIGPLKVLFVSLTLVFSLSSYAVQENPDGSITLSQQEVRVLQQQIQNSVNAVYREGAEAAFEKLKDNPKLCPKDI